MNDESAPLVILTPAGHKRKKRIPQLVCSAITYFALAVIVLLAIPMCLILGAIGGVWSVTDKIVRAIELGAK